jgi:hypothetical protein
MIDVAQTVSGRAEIKQAHLWCVFIDSKVSVFGCSNAHHKLTSKLNRAAQPIPSSPVEKLDSS